MHRWHKALIPMVAMSQLATGCGSSSDAAPTGASSAPPTSEGVACPTSGEEFETAKLYVEHNATDADTGVHGLFGGEAWSVMCLSGPDGTEILRVEPRNQLGDLTISDLFFESREPPNDEYSLDDLRRDFPEGDYDVRGVDYEGTPRIGSATFTHAIPTPPTITAPTTVDEPDAAEVGTVAVDGLVIAWEPVTSSLDGDGIDVTGYQVIVTDEDANDPNGFARPVYDVHVGADATELAVPDGWLQPDRVYELEVLAIESSGNQTISVGFFRTAG